MYLGEGDGLGWMLRDPKRNFPLRSSIKDHQPFHPLSSDSRRNPKQKGCSLYRYIHTLYIIYLFIREPLYIASNSSRPSPSFGLALLGLLIFLPLIYVFISFCCDTDDGVYPRISIKACLRQSGSTIEHWNHFGIGGQPFRCRCHLRNANSWCTSVSIKNKRWENSYCVPIVYQINVGWRNNVYLEMFRDISKHTRHIHTSPNTIHSTHTHTPTGSNRSLPSPPTVLI